MRIFEILIFLALFLYLTARLIPVLKDNILFKYLPIIAGTLIPFQLIIEGYRWQMVPVFALTVLLIFFSLIDIKSKKDRWINNKILRSLTIGIVSLLFVVCLIFPLLLPVPDLPAPNGPYTVGTMSFRMIDQNREEVFSADPDDYRNLLVTAWYPAETEKGLEPETYWDQKGVTGRAYSVNADMGTFWYSHLNAVDTNSYPDAKIADGDELFPVLIYSPAFYGLNDENTMLMEELASHGYVVFSISHTYETIVSIFPDGEVVPGNLDYVFDLYDAHADQEEGLYDKYYLAENRAEKAAILRQILVIDEESNNLLKARRDDAVFVLDEIEKFNTTGSIFQGRLDLDKAGILGWSFGGATAINVCLSDSRFKAGINIDGWPYGEYFTAGEGIQQPFMLINSAPEDEMEEIVADLIFEQIVNTGYKLEVADAWHINFWDFPYFFRIYKYIGFWGPIDPLRLREITSVYVLSFFNKELRGFEETLLDAPSALFPEIEFQFQNP